MKKLLAIFGFIILGTIFAATCNSTSAAAPNRFVIVGEIDLKGGDGYMADPSNYVNIICDTQTHVLIYVNARGGISTYKDDC